MRVEYEAIEYGNVCVLELEVRSSTSQGLQKRVIAAKATREREDGERREKPSRKNRPGDGGKDEGK